MTTTKDTQGVSCIPRGCLHQAEYVGNFPTVLKGNGWLNRPLWCEQMNDTKEFSDTKIVAGEMGSTKDNSATTTFHTDADITVGENPGHALPDPALGASANVGPTENIGSFLAKPTILATGVFKAQATGGPAAGAQIFSCDMPYCFFNNSRIWSKLVGFMTLRATLVFRLQINANKFQQGRLIMSYIPQENVKGVAKWRTMNLLCISQLPNVELDIACDADCVLKVPFTSPQTHFDMQTFAGSLGRMYVHVYSPMVIGSGDDTADYTLWGWMEDVELGTPTWSVRTQPAVATFVEQAGGGIMRRGRGKNITDVEQESAGMGPISTSLSIASKAASVLSGIPLLSSIAGTASWALNAASGAAHAFGYSTPICTSASGRMIHTTMPYANNYDCVDSSMPMSLASSNKIDVLVGADGSNVDQMSIAYIVGIPAYIGARTWNSTDVRDTVLWSTLLCPGIWGTPLTDGNTTHTVTYFQGPPFWFVDRMFTFWRGSFTVNFKVVKTSFHSGRLLLSFWPSQNTAAYPGSVEKEYCFREVIDLREKSEFSYTFPWVSTQPWHTENQSYGHVSLTVLNELTRPSTVAASVSILLEMSMADDTQFAVPRACVDSATGWGGPYIPSTFKAQMNDGEDLIRAMGDLSVQSASAEEIRVTQGFKVSPQFWEAIAKHAPKTSHAPAARAAQSADEPIVKIKQFVNRDHFTTKMLGLGLDRERSNQVWTYFEGQLARHLATLSKSEGSPSTPVKFVEHMNGGDPCAVEGTQPIANSTVVSSDLAKLAAVRYCIGESIPSLLPLLKRSCLSGEWDETTAFRILGLRPFYLGGTSLDTGPPVNQKFGIDYIGLIGACYAYNRGGVRIRIVCDDEVKGMPAMAKTVLYSSDSDTAPWSQVSNVNRLSSQSLVYSNLSADKAVELQIPAYNRLHSRLNRYNGAAQEPVDKYSSMIRTETVFSNTTKNVKVYRQASDDFAFGFFLCTPPIFNSWAVK